MESNNFFNTIQQGLRITVGAAAEIVETLKDSTKREQTLSELKSEWLKKSEIWAEKGAMTEEEARQIIEKIFNKEYNQSQSNQNKNSNTTANTTVISEIQDLNEAIINLRQELEKANQSN